MLVSGMFEKNRFLKIVATGSSVISFGHTGLEVQLIQGGLFSLGFKLPKSIKIIDNNPYPDGIFGQETKEQIRNFQSQQKLQVDGVVGPQTLRALDVILPKRPLIHQPFSLEAASQLQEKNGVFVSKGQPTRGTTSGFQAKTVVSATSPTIVSNDVAFGNEDPPIPPNTGIGPYNSKPTEIWVRVKYALAVGAMVTFSSAILTLYGQHAFQNLGHYFGNTGDELEIDVENLLSSSAIARNQLRLWFGAFQNIIESLPPGTYQLTAKHIDGRTPEDSRDWHLAIGHYNDWMRGNVTVETSDRGTKFVFNFVYTVVDVYNWNKGQNVNGTFLVKYFSDDWMGLFHLEGLAREYPMVGRYFRQIAWGEGKQVTNGDLFPFL